MKKIFDFLKEITYNKDTNLFESLSESEVKDYNIYMINRYLSMDEDLIDLISFIDKFSFNCLNKKQHYTLLLYTIPKGNYFFKYIKKGSDKEKVHKDQNKIVELLKNEFPHTSDNERIDYFNRLNENDINNLKIKYGVKK